MKKFTCMVLSFLLIAAMACCPSASATVNHCADFEDAINLLHWYTPYWNIAPGEPFPISCIMHYTRQQLCRDEYGEEPITVGTYTYFSQYAIPADVFEAAAMDFFAIADVESMRSFTSFFWDHTNFTGIDNFQNYQEDRNVYIFSNSGGMGDPSWYQVLGYQESDGLYTVYARFLSLIWGQPHGTEWQDYVCIDGDYYAIEHYLEAVVAISNGRVQFHSWQETQDFTGRELVTPLTVFAQTQAITIAAETDVFPEDITFTVEAPSAETLAVVSDALQIPASHFVAYDIQASAQPNGSAQVTFAIPQGFLAEDLALFFIDEDGQPQQLDFFIHPDNGTITAELTHFSLYVLATFPPLPGDANGDGVVNVRDARIILRYMADLISDTEFSVETADFNQDGIVNVRDARAILRLIADTTT